MKFKSISGGAVDVDTQKRQVVVYFSKFGNVDSDGDLMLPSAFTKTIKERGRKGSDLIWHLSNHRSQPEFCLGKPDLEVDTTGLKGITTFLDTSHALDVLKMYDMGLVNQHSVGFRTVKGDSRTTSIGGRYFEIAEVKLFEGSTVLWGANPDTPTVEVKSYRDLEEQFVSLTKALKTGTFTDECFIQLESQFAQMQSVLKSLKTTEPEITTQPDSSDLQALAQRLKSQFSF